MASWHTLTSPLSLSSNSTGLGDQDAEVAAADDNEEEEPTEAAAGDVAHNASEVMGLLLSRLGLNGLRQLVASGRLQLMDSSNRPFVVGADGSLRRPTAGGNRRGRNNGSDEDTSDEDEDGMAWWMTHRGCIDLRMSRKWEPIKEGLQPGKELRWSGDFGRVTAKMAERQYLAEAQREPPLSPQLPQLDKGKERDWTGSAFGPAFNLPSRISSWRRASRSSAARGIHSYRSSRQELASYMVPNHDGVEVARYPGAPAYTAGYSRDGSFYYTCAKDFNIQLYDMTSAPSRTVQRLYPKGVAPGRGASRLRRTGLFNPAYDEQDDSIYTTLQRKKTVRGKVGGWTVTDADLSPDQNWMIYSTASSAVTLIPTAAASEGTEDETDAYDGQVVLDFSSRERAGLAEAIRGYDGITIWSLRFSGDSREIVAGAKDGIVCVYDIEARTRVLALDAHDEDVNAVSFADDHSQNVLVSGSDDSFVKVWDRRSLSSGKAAGWLPGHTEGITYVCPKGDGKYLLSNGKDQACKLWDMRMMVSESSVDKHFYGLSGWDYRSIKYKRPRYASHPQDCSIMSYRGHAVLYTLIRCRFSPAATTGQQYVYSGSADGCIHVWSLDGQLVQVLDRAKATPLKTDGSSVEGGRPATDPSAPISAEERARLSSATRSNFTVRDVSWSPNEPAIMSTSWEGGRGDYGSVVKHEWKGFGKNGLTSLEDWTERIRQEM